MAETDFAAFSSWPTSGNKEIESLRDWRERMSEDLWKGQNVCPLCWREGKEGRRRKERKIVYEAGFPLTQPGEGSFTGCTQRPSPESCLSGCGWISPRHRAARRRGWERVTHSPVFRQGYQLWPHWREPPVRTAWTGRCNPSRGRDHFMPRINLLQWLWEMLTHPCLPPLFQPDFHYHTPHSQHRSFTRENVAGLSTVPLWWLAPDTWNLSRRNLPWEWALNVGGGGLEAAVSRLLRLLWCAQNISLGAQSVFLKIRAACGLLPSPPASPHQSLAGVETRALPLCSQLS